jgi:hypothetical protein
MLLEYAAQLKCRSSYHVYQGGRTIANIPSDLHQLILSFSNEATRVLRNITNELAQIGQRKSSKAKERKRYEKTAQYLANATQLLTNLQNNIREEEKEEKTIHHTTQAENEPGSSDMNCSENSNLESLNAQLAALKEQMELFSKLSAQSNPNNNNNNNNNNAVVPAAAIIKAIEIPTAPPLSPVMIPTAPALNCSVSGTSCRLSLDIPLAPPFSSSLPSIEAASHTTPSIAKRYHHSRTMSNSRVLSPSNDNHFNISANHSGGSNHNNNHKNNRPKAIALANNFYTRNIPGSESLSHNDLIQVAAKIKLRRTAVPRSPGGTPMREKSTYYNNCNKLDAFSAALASKFKNVHRSSDRHSNQYNSRPFLSSANNRPSEGDKENWETN